MRFPIFMSLFSVYLSHHYLKMFPQSVTCIFDNEVNGYQKRPFTFSGAISEIFAEK